MTLSAVPLNSSRSPSVIVSQTQCKSQKQTRQPITLKSTTFITCEIEQLRDLKYSGTNPEGFRR